MEAEADTSELNVESSTVSSAKIFDNYEWKATLFRHSFGGENITFPVPTEEGPNSEENNFGQLKDFHHIRDEDGNLGVFFQDSVTTELRAIFFTSDTSTYTVLYENQDDQKLLSAVNGKDGELYYITGDFESAGDSESNLGIKLYRVKLDGSIIRVESLKTTSASDGLDVYELGTSCQLSFYGDQKLVALYMTRIITDGDETH